MQVDVDDIPRNSWNMASRTFTITKEGYQKS